MVEAKVLPFERPALRLRWEQDPSQWEHAVNEDRSELPCDPPPTCNVRFRHIMPIQRLMTSIVQLYERRLGAPFN